MNGSLILITPCSRPRHLGSILSSIRFSIVTRWIIVFDRERIPEQGLPAELYVHAQITLAATHVPTSHYGNAQRHVGLQMARTMTEEGDPLVYFLDDDTVIHPTFYELVQPWLSRRDLFYTFDQRHGWITFRGRRCLRGVMDTGMICLPLSFCPDWRPSAAYDEDFRFIRDVMRRHPRQHVYVNRVAAYYNALQPVVWRQLFGTRWGTFIAMILVAVVAMLLSRYL
jgi:hypothetical protein